MMNFFKNMPKIFSLALAMILLASCQNSKTTNTEKPQNSENIVEQNPQAKWSVTEFSYSNLSDSESQEFVKKALLDAGISEKSIEIFLKKVREYNAAVGTDLLVKNGFQSVKNISEIHYDSAKISENWRKNFPIFPGNNCRLTAFDFFGDFIRVKNTENPNDSALFTDLDSISHQTSKTLSDAEIEKFKTFYSVIQTTASSNPDEHATKILEFWKEKGIEFLHDEKLKASLISVFFHDVFSPTESELLLGHTGIAVPLMNGEYLFIEKLSFEEPYQALKFSKKNDIKNYLMAKYDTEWNQKNSPPIIFENNTYWK